ncbi:hypothetical protein HJC23_003651 [Cyclotella cryptica]|uniref:Uncharacterized protein n=1 Tax=Cyclotella cryptica TaxID=29204 RepID=A0ABD3QR27_9STRA
MPSSLAAALAASKKTAHNEAAPEPKQPPAKPCAPSSLSQHSDKQARHINKPANKHDSKHPTSENLSPKRKEAGKQQTSNDRNRLDVGKTHHQPNHTRAGRGGNHASAGEEIVFLCDIPSDDDDCQECVEESRLDLNSLSITDRRNAGGKGRGRGGRMHNSARNNSSDNGGRVLNVNASRRMIGHALGTRLGPASNNDIYGAQGGRDAIDRKSNNNRCTNNPGTMPTPWSQKAQEFRGEKKQNIHDDSHCDVSRINEGRNTTENRIKREFSHKNGRDKEETIAIDAVEPSPMPKLESAALKGRWADEDSSDDE